MQTLEVDSAVIGSQDLIAERSARILECASLEVIPTIKKLCDEMLIISPTSILILTREPRQVWEDALTQLTRAAPTTTTPAVKWRRLEHGGQIWATPRCLESAVRGNIEIARSMAAKSSIAKTSASIEVGKRLGGNPHSVLEALMLGINEKLGTEWSEAEYAIRLPSSTWAVVPDDEGLPSGRIMVEARTEDEVKRL